MTDIAHLKTWIGRTEEATDVAVGAPLAGLAALLDHEEPPWAPNELPPLAHWLYFLPRARQSDIDVDGHPKRGGFLPPVPLPRRMWAGSRIEFLAAIPLGATMRRRSTIASVEGKSGTTGDMVFVTLRHEISVAGSAALIEEQDIVYREPPKQSASGSTSRETKESPPQSEWTRTVTPDPVQLFRYSALTFNGHRIHYDRDYCRTVEGYPGLVVHGPYSATLLVDHFLRRNLRTPIAWLHLRARAPLFDTAPFDLCGIMQADGARLWTRGPSGETAMELTLTCG